MSERPATTPGKTWRWWLFLLAAVLASIVACDAYWKSNVRGFRWGSPERAVLLEADRFEVLVLDPEGGYPLDPRDPREIFHGFPVVRRQLVDAAAKDRLITAMFRGIAENWGVVSRCFLPHHGIRASRGQETLDLVLCFKCRQIRIYSPATSSTHTETLTERSPLPVFDEVVGPTPR